jgi:hypothetical protein
LDGAIELLIAVHGSRNTGQPGGEVTASFDKPLACWHLAPQRGAFWTVGIIVKRIWSLAEVVWDTSHLNIIVRHAIRKDDGREVDLLQLWGRCKFEFLVFVVDDTGDIGCETSANVIGK